MESTTFFLYGFPDDDPNWRWCRKKFAAMVRASGKLTGESKNSIWS